MKNLAHTQRTKSVRVVGYAEVAVLLPAASAPLSVVLAPGAAIAYVADSRLDSPHPVLKVHLGNGLVEPVSLRIGEVGGLAAGQGGELYISDHAQNRVWVWREGQVLEAFAGKGCAGHRGERQGLANTAQLFQPSGIAAAGKSLLVCDSGNRALRLVTSAVPLKELLQLLQKVARIWGLEKDHEKEYSLEESLVVLREIVAFFDAMEEGNHQRTGKRGSAQGPDGNVSTVVRKAVKLGVSSLVRLKEILNELDSADLEKDFRFTAVCQLVLF